MENEKMIAPPGLRIVAGCWHYRVKHQGRDWTGSTGLVATKRNVSAALNALSKARELIRAGQADQLAIQTKRFGEAADEFLSWSDGEHKDVLSTARRVHTSFASLRQFYGNVPVHSIGPNDVEKFKTWRRLECIVQEITLRHDLGHLSTFFDFAINANWCRTNPVKKVSIPSANEAMRTHVVTDEEERVYFATALSRFELVEGVTKKMKGPFPALHDACRTILDQGMRPDEVMRLRVEHIDFEKGTLRVVKGKTKAASRTLVMTPTVKSILVQRSGGRTEGWMFKGKKAGTHLQKLNGAHDAVVAKLKQSGVEAEFVMYEFRHTFATRFGEAVGDPIALATILGHANLKTVMKYCHPRESHTAAAMKKFIATLGGQREAGAAAGAVN